MSNILFSRSSLLYRYGVFSSYAIFLLWGGLALTLREHFLDQGFFASLLLFSTWFFFKQNLWHYKTDRNISLFFLGQTICFLGMGVELKTVSPFYFVLLLSLVLSLVNFNKENSYKGIVLMFISLTAILGVVSSSKLFTQTQNSIDLIFFVSFFANVLGMMYFLKRDEAKKKQNEDPVKTKRFFYHDLMNQLHGVKLFLENKMDEEEIIRSEESYMLYKELEIVESLISEHFNLKHRSASNSRQIVAFSELRKPLEALISTYLEKTGFKVRIEYQGLDYNPQVDRNGLFRIMTNLIKNMSENGKDYAVFHFDYHEGHGLNISVYNRIDEEVREDDRHLKMLLGEPELLRGVGLESVQHLCLQEGGTFDLEVQGSDWLVKVFLPAIEAQQQKAA